MSPEDPTSVPPASPCPTPASGLPPQPLWLDDLRAVQQRMSWLWHGYLAPGNVTLLTSQWKSGKTTLASVLLARLKAGGSLAGRTVAAARAVVVTEEGPAHWLRRSEKLDLAGHVCWFCQPFEGRPSREQWLGLLDRLAGLRAEHGIDLVVFDPLAAFLPGRDESNAGLMLEALSPLRRLTSRGLSVLVLHHPRKGEALAGQAARGSGALSGYVDVLIEMRWYRRPTEEDRRRRLQAWSRYDETPRELVIELNGAGTDYLTLGDFGEAEFAEVWEPLRQLLEQARGKLTRREVRDAWPPSGMPPDEATVWRWLERARARGLVFRMGTGRRNDPFRYGLPGGIGDTRHGLPPLEELPELPGLEEVSDHELIKEATRALTARVKQRLRKKR